ncbi:NERD domain-containing protein [Streptomyces salinarius]|uniref:NERD domain-containing protein n=1 Tax=Streptomyces salinarius TaxID=2762598 RepID=UPI0028528B19|nr:NERD domain-containing protein [Streptomyces salinarius]
MLTLVLLAVAVGWAVWAWRRRTPATGAGASAERHARALRTPLVRIADALGIHTRAGTRAGNFKAAAISEARVGALLDHLTAEGFTVLHDRWLRGKNVDHIVIGPYGDVTVGDTKWWSARRGGLTARAGRLLHGRRDVTDWLDGLHWEAREVSRLLGGVPARKVVFMYGGARLLGPDGTPVAELVVDGVRIVPADQAPAVLRRTARIPGQRTRAELTARAEHVLPAHTGR